MKKNIYIPMKIEIEKINGNEIIKLLNQQTHEFEDTNICSGSFVFVEQKLSKTNYKLYFVLDYDNWGTNQTIEDNFITIDTKGQMTCHLEEPFEGDGTNEIIEEILTEWIKTHKFSSDPEHEWEGIMKEVYDRLPEIAFNDKKGIQNQIDALIKAKTYMK